MDKSSTLSVHSDQKYINALLNNDTLLLEELYQKFSGKIKQMVLQNNGSELDAADIFQDAILSLYNKAKSGKFILTCPLDAFIYLICRNKWINELNKRKSHKVTFFDVDGFNNAGEDSFRLSEECILQHERRKLLEEKLAELGGICKQLLQLSWSGKSMEEVAGLLHMTYGYARKRKTECMAKLIKLVKGASQFNSLKW